ncbi:MAG: GC-type dockerin domain-anchored protein, partial [Phycisphaerales bacterium JB061]
TEFDEGFAAITTNNSNSGSMTGSVNGVAIADTVSAGGEVEWYTFDVIALPAGALAEGEPDCPGFGNGINDGCFAGSNFGSLSIGQTINGSSGTDDADWYEVVITENTSYTLSIESESEVRFGFVIQTVPGMPGCANLQPNIGGLDAQPFERASFSGTLNPGSYYIAVEGTDNSSCGGNYTLSFRPQIPSCPPGSYEEQEPVPFDNFIALDGGTNDACVFGSLSPEDVNLGDTICGTTGTYFEDNFAANFGDQDIYRFNIAQPTVVEFEFISTTGLEAIATTTPLPATDFCSILTAGGPGASSSAGEYGSLRVALPAGDHSVNLLAAPFAADGTASGTPYILSINEYDCPADTNLDGQVTPTDFTAWVGAYNSGSIQCDQNGDGNCTPTDFSAWVGNYNNGCS